MSDSRVSISDFEAAGLSGWEWRETDIPVIVAGYRAASYTDAAAFALAVAKAADDAVHHPDIDVRYQRHARVALTTHGSGGVTQLDLDLAATIDSLAVEHGVEVDPDTPR